MAAKALGSCYPFDNTALILLCEVALGKVKEMKQFDCNAGLNKEEYDSVLGCGFVFSDTEESKIMNGIEIPLGKPKVRMEKVI